MPKSIRLERVTGHYNLFRFFASFSMADQPPGTLWTGSNHSECIYNCPMPESRAKSVWKMLAITGMCLVVIGLGAFGFDFVAIGIPFIDRYSNAFLLAIAVGVLLVLVSLIGWAAVLGKTGRTRIALITLTVPIAVILIGYALGGTNVHGPFYLFLLPMAPLFIVGLVVAMMAANARRA